MLSSVQYILEYGRQRLPSNLLRFAPNGLCSGLFFQTHDIVVSNEKKLPSLKYSCTCVLPTMTRTFAFPFRRFSDGFPMGFLLFSLVFF